MGGVGLSGFAGDDFDPFACAGVGIGGDDAYQREILHVGGDADGAAVQSFDVHFFAVMEQCEVVEERLSLVGDDF